MGQDKARMPLKIIVAVQSQIVNITKWSSLRVVGVFIENTKSWLVDMFSINWVLTCLDSVHKVNGTLKYTHGTTLRGLSDELLKCKV